MLNSPDIAGMIGIPLPHETSDRTRWADAVERMAMALSEAGYPTTVNPYSFDRHRENELVFHGKFPTRDVALRAGELCGIRDLIEKAEVKANGWPSVTSPSDVTQQNEAPASSTFGALWGGDAQP